ncbi:MAG TPA: response regulator [Chloroflexota bacterium]
MLVIEDDPPIQQILTEVLADRGHDVVALEDGAEAWARLQQEHFPLAVVDWMLPGVDGLELCRRVRAQSGGDRVFLLVTTGRNRREDLRSALDAGADDYVPKPFELSQLEARLTIAERRVAERTARVQATSQTLALIEATRVVAASAGRDLDATLAALAQEARQLWAADQAAIELAPVDDAAGAPSDEPTFIGDRGSGAATRAEMVVPLRSDEGLVGLLRLGWASPRTLAGRELEVAAAFGEHAAIAIRTARLVEASERAQRMIVAAEDRERRAVAERLHSRVKSKLVVVWYRLDQCAKLLPADLGQARELLAQACDELERIRAEDVDEISQLLHPSKVNFGLTAAIEALARDLEDRLPVTVHAEPSVRALDRFADSQIPDEVRLAAYRIVEAALDNAREHAVASKVDVWLSVDDEERLALAVVDDGVGVDPSSLVPGLGLTSVDIRVRQCGGTWTIASQGPRGTILSARLPLAAATGSVR